MNDTDRDEMPPWLQPVDEAGTGDDSEVFSGTLKKFVIGFSVIVIGLFALAMWMFYDRPADELDDPIYISAPKDLVREKPENPGGMDIPNQDKDVYNRVTGEGEGGEAKLADGAETPVSELPSDTKTSKQVDTNPAEEVVKEPVTTVSKPTTNDTVSGQLVQVGAFGSKSTAEKAWIDLVSKYPENFAGLTPVFQNLERDGRTLVRLRAGTFKDRAAADQFCQSLKDKGLSCLVPN